MSFGLPANEGKELGCPTFTSTSGWDEANHPSLCDFIAGSSGVTFETFSVIPIIPHCPSYRPWSYRFCGKLQRSVVRLNLETPAIARAASARNRPPARPRVRKTTFLSMKQAERAVCLLPCL